MLHENVKNYTVDSSQENYSENNSLASWSFGLWEIPGGWKQSPAVFFIVSLALSTVPRHRIVANEYLHKKHSTSRSVFRQSTRFCDTVTSMPRRLHLWQDLWGKWPDLRESIGHPLATVRSGAWRGETRRRNKLSRAAVRPPLRCAFYVNCLRGSCPTYPVSTSWNTGQPRS